MASGGSLSETFKKFARAKQTEMSTKELKKWFVDAGCFQEKDKDSVNNLDIAYAKTKGKQKFTPALMESLIEEVAPKYMKMNNCASVDEAKRMMTDRLCSAEFKMHGVTQTSKVGGVERMTDTSLYTGAHKERFDESGKGKGLEGRENVHDNTGYVGNYKGQGTFDEKMKK